MDNKYSAPCSVCGKTVEPGAGTTIHEDGHWITTHHTCETEVEAFTLPEPGEVVVDGTPAEKLFPHQAQVVRAVQEGQRKILLADEPGLGKTASSLVSAQAAGVKRLLVVVPAVVKISWQREIATWAPSAAVDVLSGRKQRPIDPDANVVLINYAILHAWQATLTEWAPDGLILDESHYVKDGRSARGASAKEIAGAMPDDAFTMLLSGTPIPNAPKDLANGLRILGWLGPLGGWWGYVKKYCGAYKGAWGWDMSGSAHLDELHEKLGALGMVRRLKKDVTDLPSRTVVDVPVDLPADGKRTVKAARKALVQAVAEAIAATEGKKGSSHLRV